jgi:hypothetical protein
MTAVDEGRRYIGGPVSDASRSTLLQAGILFSLGGGAMLTEAIFRGFRSWRARRTNGSVARTEPLLRRIRSTKSLLGEPLLESPPVRYWEAMHVIFRGIVGLAVAGLGVLLLLGAFDIVGPFHTNTP